MTAEEKRPLVRRRPPTGSGNWRAYLWMIVGGVQASGSKDDHLWTARSRWIALGIVLAGLALLLVISGVIHT
jgi:hypothetical protein